MSNVAKLFEALDQSNLLEWQVLEDILRCFGAETDDPNTWPITDYWMDSYDNSVELVARDIDWEPTPEQMKAVLDLGYSRCWVNYHDVTERYYTPEQLTATKYPGSKHRLGGQQRIRMIQLATVFALGAFLAKRDQE